MLITKIKGSINQANDTITAEDITGIYNATTNVGGYGTPNRGNVDTITDFIFTKPDGTTIKIRQNAALTDPVQAAVPVSGVYMPASVLSKTFNVVDLGFDPATTKFPVGVYKISYWTWYRLTGIGSVSNSSRTGVNLVGGTFTSETAGFGSSVWIKIIKNDAKEEDRYIQSIDSNTDLTVEQAFSDSFPNGTNVSIYAGYLAETYIFVSGQLMDCFQPKIAKISVTESKCCQKCKVEGIDTLTEMLLGIFGADAQFKVGLYNEANKTLQTLLKICQAEDCKC